MHLLSSARKKEGSVMIAAYKKLIRKNTNKNQACLLVIINFHNNSNSKRSKIELTFFFICTTEVINTNAYNETEINNAVH